MTSWTWDETVGRLNLNISNLAYCGYQNYANLDFQGDVEGFVVTKTIYNEEHDTEGFVGYLPSDESIYVAFRGSSSPENWVTNLDAVAVDYQEYPEWGCKVHRGFQDAAMAVRNEIVAEVIRLNDCMPEYAIKVTGHSLGGALAHHTGLYLINEGFDVSMYNFGQPRVGDDVFATHANEIFPRVFRQVHYKDLVPHVPLPSMDNMTHTATEVYEDNAQNYKTCNGSGEDKTCSDRWHSWQWNTDDHLLYMGECIGSTCGQCQYKIEAMQ